MAKPSVRGTLAKRKAAKTKTKRGASPNKSKKKAKALQSRRGGFVAGFPASTPAKEGLDPAAFEALKAATSRNITDLAGLSGCAHVVLKEGKCVFAHCLGVSDQGKQTSFSLDTICPLHGATKPLVAAAFYTLVEEGKVRLSDPVEKHIKFPSRVAVGADASSSRPAKTKPTVRQLLAMTAGIGYDDFPGYSDAMKGVDRGEIDDLPSMCEAILSRPLQHQPGRGYHYSFSTDVLGYLCEVISGERIDKFIHKRILAPLGMKDTHFEQVLPERKRKRLAVLYKVINYPRHKVKKVRGKRVRHPPFALKEAEFKHSAPGIMSCGGGVLSYRDYGMVSSPRDYLRFCQMLLEGGKIPGSKRRLFKPSTVKSWWTNSLASCQRDDGRILGWTDAPSPPNQPPNYWKGVGWTLLNTHVNLRKAKDGKTFSSTGHQMWMGGGGGAFWFIDAKRKVVTLTFAPIIGGRATEDDGLGPLANDAAPYVLSLP